MLARRKILFGFASGLSGRTAGAWRRQLYSGPSCFREADGDRLPRAARTMFACSDLLDLFMHERTRLGGGGSASAGIAAGAWECVLLRHATFQWWPS